MEHRLAAFDLERWLRRHQGEARWPIGGSGAPQARLEPFLPARAAPGGRRGGRDGAALSGFSC